MQFLIRIFRRSSRMEVLKTNGDDKYMDKFIKELRTAFKKQLSQAAQILAQWLSVNSAVKFGISRTKEAVSELKELDSILAQIGRTSNLTSRQLKELGETAFESASKYGKAASDYLTGVQEMYRAGFQNAGAMAELSLLAQAAGDMTPDSANSYLLAANKAYHLKGNVKELNSVLDAQTHIARNASVSMQDMAEATVEAASVSAQYGVQIDELSALIAVAASKTGQSGAEAGYSLRRIFEALQDTGDKSVAEALDSVGLSMTRITDSGKSLKTPVELLKELSAALQRMPEGDPKRTELLADIGKNEDTGALSAILSNWESYESLLALYSQGAGSAAREAEKYAATVEAGLNRLGNTWTDTIQNIVNSDSILPVVNTLNGFLSVINKITDALGSIGLGAGLFASFKNVGRPETPGLVFP